MNIGKTYLRPTLSFLAVAVLLFGFVYTGIVTGIAQLIFPYQANGSIIEDESGSSGASSYGSALMGQEFSGAAYLIGRPSGVSQLAPAGAEQRALVAERIKALHALDPENTALIPIDLITASGSGYDPYISSSSAEYQVSRIARTRGISEADVRKIIQKYTVHPFLGFFGEEGVNVLLVNLSLDGLHISE